MSNLLLPTVGLNLKDGRGASADSLGGATTKAQFFSSNYKIASQFDGTRKLKDLGNAISIIEKYQEDSYKRQQNTLLNKGINEYQQRANEILNNYKQLKGNKAIDSWDKYQEDMASLKKEYEGVFASHEAMNEAFIQKQDDIHSRAQMEAGNWKNEQVKYEQGVQLKGRLNTTLDTYIQNFGSPLEQQYLQDTIEAYKDYVDFQGLETEGDAYEAGFKEVMDPAARAIIGLQLDNENFGSANASLQRLQPYLTATTYDGLRGNITSQARNWAERQEAKREAQQARDEAAQDRAEAKAQRDKLFKEKMKNYQLKRDAFLERQQMSRENYERKKQDLIDAKQKRDTFYKQKEETLNKLKQDKEAWLKEKKTELEETKKKNAELYEQKKQKFEELAKQKEEVIKQKQKEVEEAKKKNAELYERKKKELEEAKKQREEYYKKKEETLNKLKEEKEEYLRKKQEEIEKQTQLKEEFYQKKKEELEKQTKAKQEYYDQKKADLAELQKKREENWNRQDAENGYKPFTAAEQERLYELREDPLTDQYMEQHPDWSRDKAQFQAHQDITRWILNQNIARKQVNDEDAILDNQLKNFVATASNYKNNDGTPIDINSVGYTSLMRRFDPELWELWNQLHTKLSVSEREQTLIILHDNMNTRVNVAAGLALSMLDDESLLQTIPDDNAMQMYEKLHGELDYKQKSEIQKRLNKLRTGQVSGDGSTRAFVLDSFLTLFDLNKDELSDAENVTQTYLFNTALNNTLKEIKRIAQTDKAILEPERLSTFIASKYSSDWLSTQKADIDRAKDDVDAVYDMLNDDDLLKEGVLDKEAKQFIALAQYRFIEQNGRVPNQTELKNFVKQLDNNSASYNGILNHSSAPVVDLEKDPESSTIVVNPDGTFVVR